MQILIADKNDIPPYFTIRVTHPHLFYLPATAQVQILIADKNDNPPYFTQSSWTTQVAEQRPDDVGRIITVTALDRDEGKCPIVTRDLYLYTAVP